MSWRTVIISEQSKLDYRLGYLVVRGIETKKVLIDEIKVLVIENPAISLTGCLIEALTEKKVKVIFCDSKRNPVSELVPHHGCHDCSAKIRIQIDWDEAIKASIWQEIISEKIRKQAGLLKRANKLKEAELLNSYIGQVELYDTTNREGHAAKVYFNALFGKDFARGMDCPINAALNYGYTLILSAINREISAAGYLNQLGINHCNSFNPFNLACDFMEPLRPLIDDAVIKMNPDSFGREEKLNLVGLLNKLVKYDGSHQYLMYALRLYCAGLFRALESGDMSEIKWIDYGW